MATRLERPPTHLIRTVEDRDAARVVLGRLDASGTTDGIPNSVLRKVLVDQIRSADAGDLPHRRRRPARRAAVLPRVTADDAVWVAPALKHFRAVHHITQKQASVKIGHSAASNPWKDYEQGRSLPTYQTLLAVIASTGMLRLVPELAPERASVPLSSLTVTSEQREQEQRLARLSSFRR